MGLQVPKLIEFFNTIQRDPRLNEILFPFYTADKVKALIQRYEPHSQYKNTGESFELTLRSPVKLEVFKLNRAKLIS